jgi:hypothetical protein
MTFPQHAWRVTLIVICAILGGGLGVITSTAKGPEVVAGGMMVAFAFTIFGIFITYFLLNQDPTDRPGRPAHGQRF